MSGPAQGGILTRPPVPEGPDLPTHGAPADDLPRAHRRFYRLAKTSYPVALAVHALLMVVFAILGEWVLAGWNVLSVLVFIWAIRSHRRGRYQAPGIPVFGEMLGHAVLCVAIVGTAPGFHYYLLVNLVIPFLVPFWRTRTQVLVAVGYAALVAGLEVWGLLVPPASPLPEWIEVGALAGNVFGVALTLALIAWSYNQAVEDAEAALEAAWARTEELLLNLLPASVAARLKERPGVVADHHEEVTVLFADLVGFTGLAGRVSPERLVGLLNRIFSAFDEAVGELGLEKIKTIGDAYMVAAGVPEPRADHADAACDLALALQETMVDIRREEELALEIRIGLHSGPLVAGVLGTRRLAWDLWGDTVNVAARMETHGEPGRVHLSDAVRRRLSERHRVEPRARIEVRGKGSMDTWFLAGPDTGG